MISELYDAENFLNNNILSKKVKKKENFVIFDKAWLEKWKIIVSYEELKEKCFKCKSDEGQKKLIGEMRELFIKLKTKEKLDELGMMDCTNLQKKIGNKKFLNEQSNFFPVLALQCTYFMKSIKSPITINSEISNGIIYIQNPFPEKDKEQKLILLNKNANSDDFIRHAITFEPNVKVKDIVKELKKKNIDEIMNQKEYKLEIINPIVITENEEEKEAERKRKEAEEAERKRKEAEEAEKKRKEAEEAEKKRKEAEDLKKQKDLEEKLKKDEEERKRKEEEEKKQKELQEKLKKEEEDRKKREEEEEERRKKQIQDEMKKNEEDEKKRKERERPVNKRFENEKIKNNIADAVKKQIAFDANIKQKAEIQDENFLISCSIINKDWYEKFLKLSNYDSIKQNLSQSPDNVDQAINNALNDKDFKIEEIKNFVKNKPQPITAKGLENIENLAFVDDEFAAKVLSLGESHDNNIISNVDNQNNNVINNNQIPPESHTKIMINNGAAIIQLSSQKYVCANINDANLNKRDNIEVIDFPENKNFDLFKEIKSNPKVGLRQAVKEKYISNIRPKEEKKIDFDKIRQQELEKQRLEKEKKEKERQEKEKKDKEQREKEEKEKKEREEKEKRERINLDNRDFSLGLDNVGATCYMNATLQCLAHIKRITEHVLNYRKLGKLKDTKKCRLSEAYSEVVWEIWLPQNKSKKSFSPNRFKEVLGEMNSLFAPTAANDAKDLLIYFIEQMHNELNQTEETNTNLVMPDNMNPMNHQEVLECFIREFSKKYKSVFSNYCYGSNVSMTFCNGCRITKYSYQCFSFIIFPLLEAKKNCVTSGRLHQMFYNNYVLNIEDCFLYNQKLEFFTGDNQMYCNICQASKDSSMQTKISAAPLVLILILNRGRGNLDFREPFTFWEIIDLTNYVEFPQPDNKYFLSGVVSHMGDSGPSGHFIAFCRMSPTSKYYCYNDSLVNESSFEEINRRGTPYILFYQKCVMVA